MTLEEREPENLGILGAEVVTYLLSQVVIHDVFKIDLIKIVGPRVEDGEAFVLDSLSAVLHDIITDEGKLSFIGRNWVRKIIFVYIFLIISNKRSNGLDA